MSKHKLLRSLAVGAAGLGTVLGASACGASSASANAPASSGGGTDTIVIKNFAFVPASLTVAAGATVTVHNQDDSTHTVTADDGRFGTGNIKAGQTVTFQVPSSGAFSYHCAIHQFMHGALTVKR
ncbi:MAG TPA: cupredoxin domain-containing protein [Acidimicrobiales bacterium]|nr:cupredoxin domain-containing protein [Acidimicrobiales bacterium]